MTKTDSASAGLPESLGRTLRGDPVALAALAGLAAAAFADALAAWTGPAAVLRWALAAVALIAGISRLAPSRERQLWTEIAGAVVLWGLAWAVLVLAEPWTLTQTVGAGAVFTAAFAAFLTAVERPGRRRGGAGSRVFAVGLFLYFVLTSAAAGATVDAIHRQLFFMLIVLDLYAAGRLIYLRGVTRETRWRMLYSLLALTMIGVFLNDLILCLRVADVMPRSAAVGGLGWSVPLIFLVLAARLRHHPFPSEQPDTESPRDEESRRRDRARRDARATRRLSEEKLNEAWRSIPDAMMISTVADGRILEVNDGFLRQFGYRRDEVLGKTGVELRLWVEPEDRAMMTRLLRERGVVHNLAFELTRKSGERRLTLLSGEIVDIEGTTCFVMVLRDVTDLTSLEVTPR